jgi:hypothetical protein
MEWEEVNDATFVASTYETGLISDRLVGNVLGSLCLTKLVHEDEWIVSRVSHIKLLPAFARVVSTSDKWVVTQASNRDGAGCKAAVDNGSGRTGKWLFFVHIAKEDISEGGNIEEVKNIMVLLDVGIERLILKSLIGGYHDGGKETIHLGIKGFGQK